MGRVSPFHIGVVTCVAALALAGCGRKGPLEPPIGAPQTQLTPAASAQTAAAPSTNGSGVSTALEPTTTAPATAIQQRAATLQDAQTRTLADTDDPGLIQSPNVVYQQSAIAKLNSATKNPARPINAAPLDKPNTFILDPLVK